MLEVKSSAFCPHNLTSEELKIRSGAGVSSMAGLHMALQAQASEPELEF